MPPCFQSWYHLQVQYVVEYDQNRCHTRISIMQLWALPNSQAGQTGRFICQQQWVAGEAAWSIGLVPSAMAHHSCKWSQVFIRFGSGCRSWGDTTTLQGITLFLVPKRFAVISDGKALKHCRLGDLLYACLPEGLELSTLLLQCELLLIHVAPNHQNDWGREWAD